eukprot:CAMPEP_0115852070 /NCGR_PEP_ID=MMETSP0287-20121206/12806_1 /TAXON_ID=412157 /ORGANISM="Chrysochromulina rotalis, Strain UIO044" /LENGTH=299 /DNA_ID=CAMNT_0003306119 /DNA_START=20 /DNA_END=919 /DNA_ORIENTATION=-
MLALAVTGPLGLVPEAGFSALTASSEAGAQSEALVVATKGLIAFTLVTESYLDVMENFVAHMRQELPTVTYEVHAYDQPTANRCSQVVSPPGSCIHNASPWPLGNTSTWYANPFYELKVEVLQDVLSRADAALMLDITALVANEGCLLELLSTDDSIVTSSSVGNFPKTFQQDFGRVGNMGTILFRRGTRPFVASWLKEMRDDLHNHADQSLRLTEQERFHGVLRRYQFDVEDRLACFKLEHDCAGTALVEGGKLGVRFLSFKHWPRVSKKSDGKCLYHPWVHSDRKTKYRQDGWWYLP